MLVCLKCKSRRIKTRVNTNFGSKSITTVIGCKDCGSTEVQYVSPKTNKRGFGGGNKSFGKK